METSTEHKTARTQLRARCRVTTEEWAQLDALLEAPRTDEAHAQRVRRYERAWIGLCELLDGWPEGPALEAALADALRALRSWPAQVRSAPTRWWRRALAGQPEPRLILARRLDVRGAGLTDVDVATLMGSKDLDVLTVLRLEGDGLGDEAAQTIAQSPCVQQLRELYLGRNDLSAEGARALARSPRLGQLRVLSLAHNPLGDAGVLALAEGPELEALRELYLDQTQAGAPAARALAVCHMRQLERLTLWGNPELGDAGARALDKRLEVQFPAMVYLEIGECGVTRALASELEARCRRRW